MKHLLLSLRSKQCTDRTRIPQNSTYAVHRSTSDKARVASRIKCNKGRPQIQSIHYGPPFNGGEAYLDLQHGFSNTNAPRKGFACEQQCHLALELMNTRTTGKTRSQLFMHVKIHTQGAVSGYIHEHCQVMPTDSKRL